VVALVNPHVSPPAAEVDSYRWENGDIFMGPLNLRPFLSIRMWLKEVAPNTHSLGAGVGMGEDNIVGATALIVWRT